MNNSREEQVAADGPASLPRSDVPSTDTVAGLRVLVCGGRDFNEWEGLCAVLDEVRPSFIIHGDASGADHLASQWASLRGVEQRAFPADWSTHGSAAGPLRNRQMLKAGKPDLVIAFPGGRGTQNMLAQAQAAGVPTRLAGWGLRPAVLSDDAPRVRGDVSD